MAKVVGFRDLACLEDSMCERQLIPGSVRESKGETGDGPRGLPIESGEKGVDELVRGLCADR